MKRYLGVYLPAIVGIILPLAVIARAPVPSAVACSGGGVGPPPERFSDAADYPVVEGSGIALLGEVLSEAATSVPGPANRQIYSSEVRTVLPLAGADIAPVIRVGGNGYGSPDCSGGPRLFTGEKVMLFLYPSRGYLAGPATINVGDWQSGQFGTPILFEGGQAYYLSWGRYSDQGEDQSTEMRQHVGTAAEVLRMALDYFDVTGPQRNEAFQFVIGTGEPTVIRPPDTGTGGLLEP
jgi:hypothetical protein